MTMTTVETVWIRHVLGEKPPDGPQHCIICGMQVAPHILGDLPAGEVFEFGGRLALIPPDTPTVSCHDR